MLDNPVYTGTLVLGNTYRSLCDRIPAHTVPEGERLVFPDAHPALVPAEVFGRVRAKRRAQKAAKRAQVAAKEADRNAMPDELAGVLFCAECGGRMILDRRFNPKTGEARGSVYKCRRHHGRGCGNDVRVAERALRIAIMDEVRVQVSTALELDRVLPGLRGSEVAVDERRRLYELYACGGVTLAEYKEMRAEADGRAADCRAALEAANRELENFDALLASDVAFEEAVAALEDLFTFSRDLVLALVRRIEVGRDGGIRIEFRFGDWRDKVASIERRLA